MPAVHLAGSPLVVMARSFAPGTLPVAEKMASHSWRAFVVVGQAVTSSATAKASLRPQALAASAARISRRTPLRVLAA